MRSILIIGYGVVGRNMHKIFPDADVVDPALGFHAPPGPMHDVAFVCVPTDMLPDGRCDTSIVEKAVRENDADVFCIKSTVPPGTTDRIAEELGKFCVFSPEFFGSTPSSQDVDFDFVILGGAPFSRGAVAEAYKERMTGAFRIAQTDAKTAECVKYGENAFLATKVTFFLEWARLCDAYGVDANEWRELLLLDPRIGRSHTFRYEDHPFYDSHCLSKDPPAIVRAAEDEGCGMPLLRAVIDLNERWKSEAGKR